ncbi:MAG: UDP-2,4-diacetamido-2,4,6-trideoxy-beta-L-altropyranose hydrolase [Desulfuromonadaceae bacterium]
MNITFRTDSSLQIGSGHVMRCLTLADELRQRGADIMFVCREHPGNMIGLIAAKGYPVVRLAQAEAEYAEASADLAHAAWLGVAWQQDAAETITAVRNAEPQWLIIDHYALDRRWEEMLRPYVEKIMAIDDLADRPHDCDLLLDQNLYEGMETRYDTLVPKSCKKLLGPKYALLRPEFAAARKNLRQRDGIVKRILVFFGGVDPTNETQKTLQALAGINDRQFDVDVVVGGGNLYKEQIKKICAANDGFHYHCQVDNMAELIAAADLAIGAGGATTWERCSVGLPSFITVLAKNQQKLAETGARQGLFFYLGKSATVTIEKIAGAISLFSTSPESLQAYSSRALATVDAKGTQRVASMLSPPQIYVRRAVIDDCDPMYEWRNAEETRRYIFDDRPIPLETHRIWFQNTLKNPDCILLVGEIYNKPVGVLRYDFSENEALISVYLVPGVQGQGVGSQLIRSGSEWIKTNCPNIKSVNAEIFKENIASLRAFESAEYKEHHAIFKKEL